MFRRRLERREHLAGLDGRNMAALHGHAIRSGRAVQELVVITSARARARVDVAPWEGILASFCVAGVPLMGSRPVEAEGTSAAILDHLGSILHCLLPECVAG